MVFNGCVAGGVRVLWERDFWLHHYDYDEVIDNIDSINGDGGSGDDSKKKKMVARDDDDDDDDDDDGKRSKDTKSSHPPHRRLLTPSTISSLPSPTFLPSPSILIIPLLLPLLPPIYSPDTVSFLLLLLSSLTILLRPTTSRLWDICVVGMGMVVGGGVWVWVYVGKYFRWVGRDVGKGRTFMECGAINRVNSGSLKNKTMKKIIKKAISSTAVPYVILPILHVTTTTTSTFHAFLYMSCVASTVVTVMTAGGKDVRCGRWDILHV